MVSVKHTSVQKFKRQGRLIWLRWQRNQYNLKLHLILLLTVALLSVSAVAVLAATHIGWLGSGASRYMVLPGDTIEMIAEEHSVPTTLLVQVNRLTDPNKLRFGQILIIPEAQNNLAAPLTYIVERGETLTTIAVKLGTTVEELIALNNLVNPSQLSVGQALMVRPAQRSQAISVLNSQTVVAQSETEGIPIPLSAPVVREHYYYVQYGDSILGIANYFGMPVRLLHELNQLPDNGTIHVGDKLIIPDKTVHEVPGKGEFIWPIDSNAIIRGYFYGHRAVDVLMPIGSPVVAASSGVVEQAGWHAFGYGNVIMLDHGDGTKTLYAHLNAIDVMAGQTVSQGQLIGETGHTGNSTHPHLHLELYVEGQAVKPCLFLTGGCR